MKERCCKIDLPEATKHTGKFFEAAILSFKVAFLIYGEGRIKIRKARQETGQFLKNSLAITFSRAWVHEVLTEGFSGILNVSRL